MRNTWLQYGGIGAIMMSTAMVITTLVKPTGHPGCDLLGASVVLAIGIASVRKADWKN